MISALRNNNKYVLHAKYYDKQPKIGEINTSKAFKYKIITNKYKSDEQIIKNLKANTETLSISTSWIIDFKVESFILIESGLYVINNIQEIITNEYANAFYKRADKEKVLVLYKVNNAIGLKL